MKVLMVGLGSVGQRHVRNLRELYGPSIELIAYRARRLTQVITPQLGVAPNEDVEALYGIQSFSSLEDALADSPDVAFIANPSSLHVESALMCARANCDLFIEKPLSNSLDAVDELVDEVRQRRLVAMVGYQLRFHPALRRFAEIVRGGSLGRLLSVRAVVGEYLPSWHRYEDYRQMYAARADLGGGVVLSQIHEYDYLFSLFGLPETVYAVGGHWSSLEIDVEDTASVLMRCTAGGAPLAVHLLQDYLQAPPSRSCEVVGDEGRATIDFHAMTIRVQHREDTEPAVETFSGFERNELFLSEIRHFFDCVAARAEPIVALEDGRASLRMALAAKESMKSDSVVRVARESHIG